MQSFNAKIDLLTPTSLGIYQGDGVLLWKSGLIVSESARFTIISLLFRTSCVIPSSLLLLYTLITNSRLDLGFLNRCRSAKFRI